MQKTKRLIAALLLTGFLGGCGTVGDTASLAVLTTIAVPVAVVTSPIWIGQYVADKLKPDAMKHVHETYGEPLHVYTCGANNVILLYDKGTVYKHEKRYLMPVDKDNVKYPFIIHENLSDFNCI